MILEGMFYENAMLHSETRPYPQYPTITAGLMVGTQAIYRYGLRESSYPTLSIVDEITDGKGHIIPPGHYELALSDDRQFLILIESKQPIATMLHDAKSLRAKNKKEKEIAKTNRRREKKGMPPVNREEEIYQEASMEYIKDGGYFLIRYERGDVKAWAAIKG